MLERMQQASNAFYGAAVQIGCHPFIEFTGLLNEYIQICVRAQEQNIDFTQCNTHSGVNLPMRHYEVDYVNQKLECIFTGRSVVKGKT